MLKHIQIPPPSSSTVVGSASTTFATTTPTSRNSRTPLLALNRSQPLNVSTLTTASNITSNGGPSLLQTYSNIHQQTPLLTHSYPETHIKPLQNGHAPRMFTPLPALSTNSQQYLLKNYTSNNHNNVSNTSSASTSSSKIINPESNGAREALSSLGLLCLVSLLLALLSLIFLLKISPGTKTFHNHIQQPLLGTTVEEYAVVFDVTLALCALSLSLNLCCLLVCAIQFLFAVKLVGATPAAARENKYLQKSSVSRVCAIGGFFISIPIFLTGIILYTFTQFHSTPAIVTSTLIGIGILFCGAFVVHNVFIWQKEKTTVFNKLKQQQHQMMHQQSVQQQQQHSSMHQNAPPQQQPPQLISRQTPLNLNLSLNSPISTIHNPVTNSSTRDIGIDQINNHSYVNGGGLAHINTTLNNTHLSLMSQQAVTPNSYHFGLRTTPPTPKSQQMHNGSPNASANLDQSNNFRNSSVTTAHELSTLV